ncbi:MAG TPA: hypothetical protein VK489_02490 [Ferruginibacter sp.]|nr:hypothetical protein [Ferruginibacter sp.]
MQAAALASKLKADMDYYNAKARVLQTKLNEMLNSYEADMQWLNTVEERLETLRVTKETKMDRLWFGNQQALVSERLERTGIVAQVKLEMQVEMVKAKAAISKNLLQKLNEI